MPRLECSTDCSLTTVRKHSSRITHMKFSSLSLLLLPLLLPSAGFFAYHTLLHFLHIISHASGKVAKRMGKPKKCFDPAAERGEKMFCIIYIFTALGWGSRCCCCCCLFVVLCCCACCLCSGYGCCCCCLCLRLFLAGHPSSAWCVLAFVRRACFGFWFYRFASCRATEPVALINKLSGVLTSRRCSYSSWFA